MEVDVTHLPWRGLALSLAVLGACAAPASAQSGTASDDDAVSHVVVIYQENHSFDNLYGGWERVDGVATPIRRTRPRSTRPGRRTSACCRTTST
jgi:phospholipase C